MRSVRLCPRCGHQLGVDPVARELVCYACYDADPLPGQEHYYHEPLPIDVEARLGGQPELPGLEAR